MFSLAEENTVWALKEKLPTKSGNLLVLTSAKLLPEIRNTLSVSVPEGSHYEEGNWSLPNGDKIWVRNFEDKVLEFEYDLWVCTGGDILSPAQSKTLSEWRKRDAL